MTLYLLFWILLLIITYNYLGYTLLMGFLSLLKGIMIRPEKWNENFYPEVSLVIPSYNELDYIDAKIKNTKELTYPKDKLKVIWVTDGSDDGSVEKLKEQDDVILYHQNKRNGKIGAVNRVMQFIQSPYAVFCDANSMLNPGCIEEILKPFQHKKTGCVAGQKHIFQNKHDKAVGSGEGIYWNYESALKKFESNVYSCVGAAGELFAIRRDIFEEIPGDSIVEDFVISLLVIRKKYKTKYAPAAVANETSSLNIGEEMKRKTRIAYGSIQTLLRYPEMLNPLKYGFFSFQYFSHKVLRWTLVPLSMPVLLLLNLLIIRSPGHPQYFDYLFLAQAFFYILAILGMVLKEKKISFRIFFIPFYVCMMNFSILKGYVRYLKSEQSVSWEKAKRS